MRRRTSLKRDLSDIQRRLRRVAVLNDRAHERLAMKYHREEVVREAGSCEDAGEVDARYEGRRPPGAQV